MQKPLNTVLVGAGGYAELYVRILLDGDADEYLRLTAIVDPYAKKSSLYDKFKDAVPVYEHMEDCYKNHSTDFTIIATPIPLHYNQSMTALGNGSHVMCEKPLVPSVAQLDLLEEKCNETGKTLSVGFQQCYSSVMREIKKRVLAGEFGRPVRMKTFVSWPRIKAYYNRAAWPGKLTAPDGELIRDAVATNATSHYLQNMLYILGWEMDKAAGLDDVMVECYKANDIETFDTIVLRGEASGVEVYFYASHATNYNVNPVIYYEFEKACITANYFTTNDLLEVHHKTGIVENHGNIFGDATEKRPVYTAQSILGERAFDCTIETVRPFTELTDKIFTQVEFHDFPDEYVIDDIIAGKIYVKNLHMDMSDCFISRKLPSEAGLPWAKRAKKLT